MEKEKEKGKQSLLPMDEKQRKQLLLIQNEKEVIQILVNLTDIIENKKPGSLPVWGVRKRRSALNLVPSPKRVRYSVMNKKKAEEASPASPLLFSAACESDDKKMVINQQSKKIKKKSKKKLLEKLSKLVEAKESLTKELESVHRYHLNLKLFNKVLKAKKVEMRCRRNNSTTEEEIEERLSLGLEMSQQNKTPFPFLLENQSHPPFLSLLQQQSFTFPTQFPNLQTPPLPTPPPSVPVLAKISHVAPPGLPDLNEEVFDDEDFQPSVQALQSVADGYKARAAEARKRRMVKNKERKINVSPAKQPKC